MSFNFSKSLIGDIYCPLSQELEDSQDSGYGVYPSNITLPPSAPTSHPASFPFPPRRTLPRPPSMPNLNQPQQGESLWKFGGRNEWGRGEVGKNHLERDLKDHLAGIIEKVNNMPGKVSTIVLESVKYLRKVFSKEDTNIKAEVQFVVQLIKEMKGKMTSYSNVPGENIEMLGLLEAVLADCAGLAEAVNGRQKRIENKLAGLLLKLDKMTSISRKMVELVFSSTDHVNNIIEMKILARNIVNKEMSTSGPSAPVNHHQNCLPSTPTRNVSTKPLPSFRLPSLTLQSDVTDLSLGGRATVRSRHVLRGGLGRRGDGLEETGQSDWRRVGKSGFTSNVRRSKMIDREIEIMEILEIDSD